LHSFLNAADSLGIPRVPDIHDPSIAPYAAACLDVTVDEHGRRVSTFDSFLPPNTVNARRNLYICPDTVTCRVDVVPADGGPKAIGVYIKAESATDNVEEYYVSAVHEVILCAGAIATPQILMLRYFYLVSNVDFVAIDITDSTAASALRSI
jgi:choline dehydrogenase